MKYQKVIKKYTKIRGMPEGYAKTAIRMYQGLNQNDRNLMLQEFQDYIDDVSDGTIIPTPVPIPKS